MQINKNLKFIIFCFIVFLSLDSHTDDGLSISAVIETPQVEINGNADDPAIWFNEVDPSLSIVFGTDKYNGVYSYNLSGDVIGFSKSGSICPSPRTTGTSLPSPPFMSSPLSIPLKSIIT